MGGGHVIMEHVGDGFDTQAVTLEEFLGINGSDQNPDDWGYSLYWGYTSRMLADEALRWLTIFFFFLKLY